MNKKLPIVATDKFLHINNEIHLLLCKFYFPVFK